MIDIIELAKKAGFTDYTETDQSFVCVNTDVKRFAALYKQALIDSGELVDKADAVDAERYRWLRENGDKGIFVFDPDKKPRIELAQRDELDTIIDRARSTK